MNLDGFNIKRWIGALLLIAAGIMTVVMAVSTNNRVRALNEKGLSLQDDYASSIQKVTQISELLNKIPALEHKHILASSKTEKEKYTSEMTSYQNDLLNRIYSLENELDEESRKYLYEAKEAFAFFTTNTMQVQDYSFKGMRSKAWDYSKSESEPSLKAAIANIDSLRDSMMATNILYKQELEQEAEEVRSSAYNKLYFVLFLIVASIVLFLLPNLKSAISSSKTSPAKPESAIPGPQTGTARSGSGRSDKSEGWMPGSAAKTGEGYPRTRPPGAPEGLSGIGITPDDIKNRVTEREENRSRVSRLLNEASELSSRMGPGTADLDNFDKLFDNSRQVTGLLKSISDISTSSIIDAQETTIKLAKVGEYEVRKLAYAALKISKEIQDLMLDNYNKMVASIKEAERFGKELQGTIASVSQVSRVLEEARGSEDLIDSLENYMQATAPAGPVESGPGMEQEAPREADGQLESEKFASELEPEISPESDLPEAHDKKVDRILDDVGKTEEELREIKESVDKDNPQEEGRDENKPEDSEDDDSVVKELSDNDIEEALANTAMEDEKGGSEPGSDDKKPEEFDEKDSGDDLLNMIEQESSEEKQPVAN
jgi:hypothetical protein